MNNRRTPRGHPSVQVFYHMQPPYISNGRHYTSHSLHTKTPHKFFLILWLIYYTYNFSSLWREGFCFVKSRQVCFLGMRGPNTPTKNGYFSVSPFWNMYYKIVDLQYLVVFNLQSPPVWCLSVCLSVSDIVSYIHAPPIPATNVI
jgi:hypothetical protein